MEDSKKILKIDFVDNFKIVCHFENNELRILDLSKSINDKYAAKILSNENIFKTVKIGEFGEIYWSDMGEIKDINGKIKPCEYDISPEFAYLNSQPLQY